jgi:adenine-specific DNA-methyltransferase
VIKISDYIKHHSGLIYFKSSSWVVLSAIEQQIKQKIEAVGKPLKEWDIQINYGIKTGFNEAFIIDTAKRNELIEKCPEAEEIIRPILRGRDIKKYKAEWAGLYLISTFPSLRIDIEEYPAVKEHLLSFGYDRLKQTGDNGARKKTHNQWFETQDSISYWEDFSKQKIVWKIIGDQMAFFIDSHNYIVNNACYILTGDSLVYLVAALNSRIIKWYSYQTNMNKTGVGDMQVGAQNVVLFPIPFLSQVEQISFVHLVESILEEKENGGETSKFESEINMLLYKLYNLSKEEIDFIELQ